MEEKPTRKYSEEIHQYNSNKITVSAVQTLKQRVYLGTAEGKIGSKDYIITDNLSKTKRIRTTQYYQIISEN